MPRRSFHPTKEQRELVKHLAAVGTPHELIGRKLGIRSPKTLRKHFREEIDFGSLEANASVAASIFKKAMSGNVEAQKFWMMSRAGWGQQFAVQRTASTPAPFVVAREEEKEAA